MEKVIRVFIVLTLLAASAFSNVSVYQCLSKGEFCITKSCCPLEETASKESCCPPSKESCCSEEPNVESDKCESGQCCTEYDSDMDDLEVYRPNNQVSFELEKDCKDLHFYNQNLSSNQKINGIRGSPPPLDFHTQQKTNLYKYPQAL